VFSRAAILEETGSHWYPSTELRIHTYPFDDERGQCFDLDECTVYRSSPGFVRINHPA